MLLVGGVPEKYMFWCYLFEWLKQNNPRQLTISCYCQNPNLTTTQAQPNLNLVGFFDPGIFFDPKIFLTQKFVWPKKFTKTFCNLFSHNIFDKNFLTNFLGHFENKSTGSLEIVFVLKKFCQKITMVKKCYCQNPNLTTTQPDLNIVLCLTQLFLFTPPSTPPSPLGILLLLKIKVLVVWNFVCYLT